MEHVVHSNISIGHVSEKGKLEFPLYWWFHLLLKFVNIYFPTFEKSAHTHTCMS